jgi:hypothetical protein
MPLVALVRRIPTVTAAVLGVFAVPAFVVTVAFGFVLESAGIPPQTPGVGLVSDSDLLFLVVAYLLSVATAESIFRFR